MTERAWTLALLLACAEDTSKPDTGAPTIIVLPGMVNRPQWTIEWCTEDAGKVECIEAVNATAGNYTTWTLEWEPPAEGWWVIRW